ncbi:MAG: CotH kinase family protein, partial [Candidatus Caccovivens sp.]
METKKRVGLCFLVVVLSVISIFSITFVDTYNFSGFSNRKNVVYAEGQNVVYDNFDLESLPYEISANYDTGWKTYDGRNASLCFSDGTAVSESGIFFELGSSTRNSYYRNVTFSENETYDLSLVHRGRFGADTLALIVGEAQQDDNSQIVNPTINSSSLDQFMQMSDWIVSNGYMVAKEGVEPSMVVYSKKFSTAGGFVGQSESNFSIELTEECTEKWTVVFITSDYYQWVEHNLSYTAESSAEHVVALTHVKSRGKNTKNNDATTGEGNLIRSFSITDSADNLIYLCDESFITDATKSTVNSKGYTTINAANNATPYSTDIWNVTESVCNIEIGRTTFNAYAIMNLSEVTHLEGDAFLLSHGVYKDFDFSGLTTDYFNVNFFTNSRYQQLFRVISIPKNVQITTDNCSMMSQIDYIEQYINANDNLKNSLKLTIYTSNFDANGSFSLPLSDAFSLQKDSKHQIKVDIYNCYSSTSWNELNVVFDNTDGTYDDGIKICFGGCGLDQVASIFLDSITVESCTFDNTFEGSGSRNAPYKIQTAEEFAFFRKIVYSGRTFSGVYFEQTANLEFDTVKFDCVVGVSPNFAGVYNGNGHTLSNITMDYSNYSSIKNTRSSLFYNVSGSIINLGLEDSSFIAEYVSTFADNLTGYGNISNCYANNISVGGTGSSWGACIALIVTGDATLENIYFNGTLTGPSDANNYGVASYRSKTCSISNILTTSTQLLKAVNITSREFANCAIKTEDELKTEEVLELLNSYASAYGFNAWQVGENSFPEISQNVAGIALKSFTVSDTRINENINWYYSTEVGEYYLLLPKYFDIKNLSVSYTIVTEDMANAYIEVYNDDEKVYDLSQNSTYDFSNLNHFKVRVSDSYLSKDYTFNLMQGGNASIFISLKNGGLDFSNINMDASHNTGATGEAKIVDCDGNIMSQQIKEMRGRGNFSWGLTKKPYQLKFEESFSMLGMKENKTWLLIANYTDGSLSRTALFYELSTWFGIDYSVEFEVA